MATKFHTQILAQSRWRIFAHFKYQFIDSAFRNALFLLLFCCFNCRLFLKKEPIRNVDGLNKSAHHLPAANSNPLKNGATYQNITRFLFCVFVHFLSRLGIENSDAKRQIAITVTVYTVHFHNPFRKNVFRHRSSRHEHMCVTVCIPKNTQKNNNTNNNNVK